MEPFRAFVRHAAINGRCNSLNPRHGISPADRSANGSRQRQSRGKQPIRRGWSHSRGCLTKYNNSGCRSSAPVPTPMDHRASAYDADNPRVELRPSFWWRQPISARSESFARFPGRTTTDVMTIAGNLPERRANGTSHHRSRAASILRMEATELREAGIIGAH